ncbi:nitrilase-related carbon-nitrogen hydrolase [Desulfurivibrio alkaliphilus]|uniref:Nitrilase/cyanide hydratase and apolipoprotein N-acyltransferase n=1 Tax=Desulfurivibrio alkaliphilus (strain DSM 19089 / UNIQEM U267 / AHT2) TaxID=589865 RepID=D6Z534_DESAT|nr:nitrilase-related carbon-nitrogen hydrolase [Desulfurivibrio alkaliphilus]ADH86659.1 Nitrilase/cyanide hydratase and apolipoprotein N-acyltransferase [Desulfurivibrio alkaliphilus AHT 2]
MNRADQHSPKTAAPGWPSAAPVAWPPRAGVLQFRVRFGDPAANLAVVQKRLAALAPPPGTLVLLPELWSGGFAYHALAGMVEETPSLLAALAAEAHRYDIFLAGSLPEAPPAASPSHLPYNTLYLVGPRGVVGSYHKQRLFAPMGEPEYFRPGALSGPIAGPAGPVGGLVCFDLRFPELTAAQVRRGGAVMLVAAQWPRLRQEHWRILLRARAIENQIFVVACNTCGRVGDTDFAGCSAIVAPDGELLAEAAEQESGLLAPLDFARLNAVRSFFQTAGGIAAA